ncbi:Multifunctional pyrimidine synthesis protein CAD [Entomophthora muscae]|uniref:Multifunctional pyrimidine synthesis protein CAD n=1 Tax=Entomophthora muscae TaxID=34485 RepID=A0ACC2TZ69_9FUNG|nr:Multifunctional pyrimidine synthesis protein CAD [Entomophthora muscae]
MASFGKILRRSFATVSDSAVTHASGPLKPGSPAYLRLKSGQVFSGVSFGANSSKSGEAVFSTSTVGYPESMTDPSYRGQILVFTQPLIGNYGVPSGEKDKHGLFKFFESDGIQVEGIVVNDYATKYSHWNAIESLSQWCRRYNVPAISGIDTRAVVHILREQGSTLASIDSSPNAERVVFDPNTRNLVAEVSTKHAYTVGSGDIHIGVIDCGIKHNILRSLLDQNVRATVLPWDCDLPKIMHQFDGLFISNGPGNPTHVTKLIDNLRIAVDRFNKPIFGICMGNQLIGQAAGLGIYKMQFGNRGHNQPAIDVSTGRCFITSQNHGYALDDKIMPPGWRRHFVNANDGSNEGIIHESKPIASVQFHPEAKGGPEDTMYLFQTFASQVRQYKSKNTYSTKQSQPQI